MAKVKEKNAPEYYKGLIRDLKAQNKSLKKELARLQKREHLFDLPEIDEDAETATDYKGTLNAPQCPECGSKQFESVKIGNFRLLERCFDCGMKKSTKL